MTIGIIVASVRKARIGENIAQWVYQQTAERNAEYTVIDIADFDLPFVTGAPPNTLNRNYDNAEVTRFSDAIAACDAFVVVTPEYNHSVPGALKNAIDSLGSEWNGKPVAYVAYSYDGGVRVADHLRIIFGNFSMPSIRSQININLNSDVQDGKLISADWRDAALQRILTELEAAASK